MGLPRPGEGGGNSGSQAHQASSLTQPNYKGRVRTGCLVCRARKVKCDEQRPSCQKCTRLNKTCVYKIPRRWDTLLTPGDSNPGNPECQEGRGNSEAGPISTPTRIGNTTNYPTQDQSFLNNPSDAGVGGITSITFESERPDASMSVPVDESSASHHTVDVLPQGHDLAFEESQSDRYQRTSQLIYFSMTMDWLGASEPPTPSSFFYFNEAVSCPFITPFDQLNWARMKTYIAQLGLQQDPVAKSILAVQVLYRAQVDRLPMSHAMSVYQAAITSFESISGDHDVDFHLVLVVAFLLCLCVTTLPNEDGSSLGVLDGVFTMRLEAFLLSDPKSPVSLRICSWLRLLNLSTKRPGTISLLSGSLCQLLHKHVNEVPSLSELDRNTSPENSLYDIVSSPVFSFYLEVQNISNRIADVTHYRRSRTTSEDQAEVTDILTRVEADLFALWENRPAPLRLQLDRLRDHFSAEIANPLIALARVCIMAYHAEVIVVGRILGDPPFPTPASKLARTQIREIVEGDSDVAKGNALNPGYLRPLFIYALESFDKGETDWAADSLRQIKDPISRSHFLASFLEAHGEAQRAYRRRVTMKYFCYQTFGVPLPFL